MSQAKMPFIAVDIKICRKWLISSNQLKTRKLIMCSVVLIDVQSCYRVGSLFGNYNKAHTVIFFKSTLCGLNFTLC